MEKLYVLISQTHTGMAKLIRVFTRYPYNHVSLSLDPSHRNWVSFARLFINTPLAGGMVEEPVERLLCLGDVQADVFCLPITPEYKAQLEKVFALAGKADSGLVYDLFSAALSLFHLRWPIPGAYTCLDFACAVLGEKHTSIRALQKALEPYRIYTGSLGELAPDSGDRSHPYFTKNSLPQTMQLTLRQWGLLLCHTFRRDFEDPIGKCKGLHRT